MLRGNISEGALFFDSFVDRTHLLVSNLTPMLPSNVTAVFDFTCALKYVSQEICVLWMSFFWRYDFHLSGIGNFDGWGSQVLFERPKVIVAFERKTVLSVPWTLLFCLSTSPLSLGLDQIKIS